MKRLIKYQTPILSAEIEEKIDDAVQGFVNRKLFREWGIDTIRDQGTAVLMHGQPGTGKTISAHWIAKKLHLKLVELSAADYGTDEPGQLARNIKKIFGGEQVLAKQENRNTPIIFLDECDAVLVSRKKLGPDMQWMLEPITSLLVEIGKYPGLVLLATNMANVLDEALERRLIAKIRFERPDEQLRYKMWKAKWPKKFPAYPTDPEFWQLAGYDLSGAQIENAFLLWAGRCVKTPENLPRVSNLIVFIEKRLPSYMRD